MSPRHVAAPTLRSLAWSGKQTMDRLRSGEPIIGSLRPPGAPADADTAGVPRYDVGGEVPRRRSRFASHALDNRATQRFLRSALAA
jgi:hypothetical protein